jgi:hypothetical protein
MGRKETLREYHARIDREVAWAKANREAAEGHALHVEHDWNKAFASRPGSDDWLARCGCGWTSSKHYHGEAQAWAGAGRHLRKVLRDTGRETTSG